MRTLLTTLAILSLSLVTALGQNITYDIPEGYEDNISSRDYQHLVDLVIPVISSRYVIDHVREGVVHLGEGQEIGSVNLHDLIHKCAAEEDRDRWSDIIGQHFNALFTSFDEQKNIDLEDYEAVRKYLSLRIYTANTVTERGGTDVVVARVDLDGTYTLVMLDLPGAFMSLQRSTFDHWNKDENEVFTVAQENVNRQQVEKLTQEFEMDGRPVELSFLGNEDYAASYALDLANNAPELVGEWGSVVAIPNKGLANICKVSREKPLDFVKFIQLTKSLIEESFKDHPQPISDEYFWYYDGRFTRISVMTGEDGGVIVISPAGLNELMASEK